MWIPTDLRGKISRIVLLFFHGAQASKARNLKFLHKNAVYEQPTQATTQSRQSDSKEGKNISKTPNIFDKKQFHFWFHVNPKIPPPLKPTQV